MGAGDGVARTAALLRALADAEPGGGSTSALARAAGLPRATTHRLLTSLAGVGLADRDRATGAWHVGPELYVLGTAASRRYDMTATAQPSVRRLADLTGESAFFSVRRGDETVCLVREDGSFPLRSHVLHEGARFPLGVVSAGMAVLAHLPDEEVEAYLERSDLAAAHGPQHAPDLVRAHVARTRQDGWATNPGLVVQGSWGMAAAVFDAHDRPVAALSITGVEHRFADERRPELGRLLLREAHALGGRLRDRV
ncbi:IclR family transcriptional regulator [Nocardioides sp. GY 10127]|nr:IclR family transcriptional regulator [Nocardioides sp. GY 10127]